MNKRIFDSIEDIKEVFGVDVVLRKNLPENCNVVMYQLGDKPEIRPVDYYLENGFGLFYVNHRGCEQYQNQSLEDEVIWDDNNLVNSKYIYLRLAQKHKFTPERMLGVETTLGYITTIINERVVMLSRNNTYWYNLNLLKYYTSDDSDETVSFDEYVKLFYDTEGVL